jgi:DHA3 family macrolide efflux protein-like MFS transporter
VADGTSLAVFVDAVTFFLAGAVLPLLTIPSPRRRDLGAGGKPGQSIWADMREGALYIWRRRPLLWLLLTFAVVNLCLPLGVLMPLMVKFNLAADWTARGYTYETALALLNSVGSIGGLAGGLIISAWGGLKHGRVYGVLVSILVGGLAQVLLGLSPLLFLAAAGLFLLSATGPAANAHSQAIWQTQTPREMQGRVFAVRRFIAQCTTPLGTALAGWMGARLNPGLAMAVLGAVVAVAGLAQLFNPVILRVEDKAYLDNLAQRAAGLDG